jgi:uncharacterized protein
VRELEVTLPGEGVPLAGTLTLPEGDAPHPTALILPGSGPIDRNADHRRMRLGISRDLGVALAEHGIASLRYDKRGVGRSGGRFLEAGMSDNIADARAALGWLRSRPEVRPDALFAIGHSEGAYGAMSLAAEADDDGLAGVVLLSASATLGERMLAWQTRQVAASLPRPVRLLLRLLRVNVVRKQQANVARLRSTTTDVARIGGRKLNARWHRELLDFDPVPLLAKLRMPVLAITGDKDLQVDPDDLKLIAETVPGPVETVLVPDLTHVLRRDPKPPSVGAYRKLVRRPVDQEVLTTVADWVRRVSGEG